VDHSIEALEIGLREWYWAQRVPSVPTDALITVTGLPPRHCPPRSVTAQSMACLSTPGIEQVYSGVANFLLR